MAANWLKPTTAEFFSFLDESIYPQSISYVKKFHNGLRKEVGDFFFPKLTEHFIYLIKTPKSRALTSRWSSKV